MRKAGKLLLILPVLILGGFLISCGGGGGGGGTSGGGGGGNTEPYIGYYEEDPDNNPEDPTAGNIFVCLPEGDGKFTGQFLFSYVGCFGGIDLGNVSGYKTDTGISGQWSGTVDGVSIGGSFESKYDSADQQQQDVYSGNWFNSDGKVKIGPFPNGCEYWVAARGTWKVYGPNGNDVQVSGDPPTFSWNPVPEANYYLVSVYDKEKICPSGGFGNILMWQAITTNTTIQYGADTNDTTIWEIVPEKQLQHGRTYIVTVIAAGDADLTSGTVKDFKAFLRSSFTY